MNSAFIKKYKTLIRILFILALTALLYGIFRSTPPERLFEDSDKVGHFIAFFVVSFLGRFALYQAPHLIYWSVCLLLSYSLEYFQEILRPLRHFSAWDAFANASGVIFAMFLCFALTKITLKTAKEVSPRK